MMWDALRWRQAGKRKPATGGGFSWGHLMSLLQMRKQEQKRSLPSQG